MSSQALPRTHPATTWDHVIDYEVAVSTIGIVIGSISIKCGEESVKDSPDKALIAQWEAEIAALNLERDHLRIDDPVAIKAFREKYAPIARAYMTGP
jgi:hypothetical protein